MRHIAVDDDYLALGANDVLIDIAYVGICGSDVHYYKHGHIGDFVVKQPMILGHEASGIIAAIGKNVTHLAVGDNVCIEPGIPDFSSDISRKGLYNLDAQVKFWATPPIHGCLTPQIKHPAALVYKLPDNVSLKEGALIEPLAVGVQAAKLAAIKPGDTALVIGCGTIGLMTALSAKAAGCSKIIVSDISDDKLAFFKDDSQVIAVNPSRDNLHDIVSKETAENGVDIIFEASGYDGIFKEITTYAALNGRIILIGMPLKNVEINIIDIEVKELSLKGVFRYANVWKQAINMVASGKIALSPLISDIYNFDDSVAAFKRAAEAREDDIKIQIKL